MKKRRKWNPGPPKKCKATGKTRYPTQSRARAGMMYIISHDSSVNMFDMHTYECDSCKGWHIGHVSYYQKALQKRDDTVSPSA